MVTNEVGVGKFFAFWDTRMGNETHTVGKRDAKVIALSEAVQFIA